MSIYIFEPIYALSVYHKNLMQKEIACLENLQYRTAKVVTGALHFTSREKLNAELGWETISQRGDFLGLNAFHKIHLHETRPLIRNGTPKLDIERKFELRSKGGYIPFKTMEMNLKHPSFPTYLACGILCQKCSM
jgi:hypothetical protein